jgi:hypothetical protein
MLRLEWTSRRSLKKCFTNHSVVFLLACSFLVSGIKWASASPFSSCLWSRVYSPFVPPSLFTCLRTTKHYHLLKVSAKKKGKKLFQSREMNPTSHVSWDAWSPFKGWFISKSSIKDEKEPLRKGRASCLVKRVSESFKSSGDKKKLSSQSNFLVKRYTNLHCT